MTRPTLVARLTSAAFAVAVLGAAPGCGPAGPEVYQVSGVLTRDGEPCPNMKIIFSPQAGRASWGFSDAEGKFELHFSKQIPMGALPGVHTVWLDIPPGTPGERHAETGAIMEEYGGLERSPLQITIDEDGQFVELKVDGEP